MRGLVLLLAVLSTLLGAVALSTHLKADVVKAPRIAKGESTLYHSPGYSTEGEHDPFALAKQQAIAEELPPQF